MRAVTGSTEWGNLIRKCYSTVPNSSVERRLHPWPLSEIMIHTLFFLTKLKTFCKQNRELLKTSFRKKNTEGAWRARSAKLISLYLANQWVQMTIFDLLKCILGSSLNFIRLLRVVFSSQQRLNRPAVNAVQWRHYYPKTGWWFWLVDFLNIRIIMENYDKF